VPFDVAFSLDPVTSAAFSIIFGNFRGRRFDFERWGFADAK
jgi:hypothetical protein